MSVEISIVKKRDGRIVKFNQEKIHSAVYKAMCAAGKPDSKVAGEVTKEVMKRINAKDLDVEHIQDLVEMILLDNGYSEVAKAFIIYRNNQRQLREEKCKILNKKSLDEVDKAFDSNSLRVLASRYLIRNEKGEIIESPKELFTRVATHIGIAEIFYDPLVFVGTATKMAVGVNWAEDAEQYYNKLDNFDHKFHIGKYYLNKYHFEGLIRLYANMFNDKKVQCTFNRVIELLAGGYFDKYAKKIDEFYNLMVQKIFLPNTPTLMNAGSKLGQLSACFVLGIDDSLNSIMKTAHDAARIFQSGGGVGISYSNLRPEGDMVFSTSGVASGPVSFMNIINTVTEVVKQGGKRRGANMGILHCHHPDVEKFITAKTTAGVLENFNVSVGVWEEFWDAYNKKGKYPLINPRNGEAVREIDAAQLMDTIALSAWKSAEPGVIFFDNINKYNPLIEARGGPITATNPCGEQSLYPYESCNLGSINLAKFVYTDGDDQPQFNWKAFEDTVRMCVRFLDNVIDMNKYPIPEINKASRETRRIGLGIMGLADALYLLNIPYNSQIGYDIMNFMAESLSFYSTDESVELAKIRGEFDLYDKSSMRRGEISIAGITEMKGKWNKDWDGVIEKVIQHGIRNSWTTTIAPTGSLSMIADCSNGVEPTFSIAFQKKVAVGDFNYSNKIFKDVMVKHGLHNDELVDKIAHNYGSVKGVEEIPKELQEVFVTAMDIHWLDHVVAQAIWQKWIGNAIAKTINMSEDATMDDIKTAYLLSHGLGLKGVTVYRDNSRHAQVLHVEGERTKNFDVTPTEAAKSYVKTANVEITYKDPSQPTADIRSEPLVINDTERPVRESVASTSTGDLVVVEIADNLFIDCKKDKDKDKKKDDNICKCGGKVVKQAGCCLCISCGWSTCTVG